MKEMNNKRIRHYVGLYLTFLLYSFSTVLSKFASMKDPSSIAFWLLYGGTIFILGCYAVCWQRILRVFKLNFAYANKAILIILGMLWGVLLFDEKVTLGKIMGAIIVSIGIWVTVKNE